jgi:hypothetical protein
LGKLPVIATHMMTGGAVSVTSNLEWEMARSRHLDGAAVGQYAEYWDCDRNGLKDGFRYPSVRRNARYAPAGQAALFGIFTRP